MLTPANIGIMVAILAVVAAYFVGFSNGHSAGQERGYGDGKRDGSKEGSMRGYAVGYDRAKRRSERDEGRIFGGAMGFGVTALLVAMAGIFALVARGNQSKSATERAVSQQPMQVRSGDWSEASGDRAHKSGPVLEPPGAEGTWRFDPPPQRDSWGPADR